MSFQSEEQVNAYFDRLVRALNYEHKDRTRSFNVMNAREESLSDKLKKFQKQMALRAKRLANPRSRKIPRNVQYYIDNIVRELSQVQNLRDANIDRLDRQFTDRFIDLERQREEELEKIRKPLISIDRVGDNVFMKSNEAKVDNIYSIVANPISEVDGKERNYQFRNFVAHNAIYGLSFSIKLSSGEWITYPSQRSKEIIVAKSSQLADPSFITRLVNNVIRHVVDDSKDLYDGSDIVAVGYEINNYKIKGANNSILNERLFGQAPSYVGASSFTNTRIKLTEDLCVINSIHHLVDRYNQSDEKGFKKYTVDLIINDFYHIVKDVKKSNDINILNVEERLNDAKAKRDFLVKSGISLADVITWSKDQNVSMTVYDHFGRAVYKDLSRKSNPLVLKFICANSHAHLIEDQNKNNKAKSSKLVINEIKIYYKDDVTIVNSVDDLIKPIDDIKDILMGKKEEKIDQKDGHYIIKTNDLRPLISRIVSDTGKQITSMKHFNGHVTSFTHPLNANLSYSCNPNYDLIRKLCTAFNFNFTNQGVGSIVMDLLERYNKLSRPGHPGLAKSLLPEELKSYFKSGFALKPYIAKVECERLRGYDSYMVVDSSRAYQNSFFNNKFEYPVYYGFESSVPFSPLYHYMNYKFKSGYYFIDVPLVFKGTEIVYEAGYFPHNLVEFAFNRGDLDINDIKRVILPYSLLEADYFKVFITFLRSLVTNGTINDKDLKILCNSMWGCLRKSKSYTSFSMFCNELEDVEFVMRNEIFEHKRKAHVSECEDGYILTSSREVKDCEVSIPIAMYPVADGIINLVKIHDLLEKEKIQVVGYNTDCVKFFCKSTDNVKRLVDSSNGVYRVEKEIKELKELKPICGRLVPKVFNGVKTPYYFGYKGWTDINKEDVDLDNLKSCLITGGAGCGKSTLFSKIIKHVRETEEKDSYCVMTFTHKAKNVLHRMGIQECLVSTSYLSCPAQIKYLKNYKYIFIDEVFTMPKEHIRKIIIGMNRDAVVICSGDPKQLPSIEEDNVISTDRVDYLRSPLFMRFCGNRILKLTYIEGCARFCPELKAVSDRLCDACGLKTWNVTDKMFKYNICKTNEYRENYNLEYAMAAAHDYANENKGWFGIHNSGKSFSKDEKRGQHIYLAKGMPIICTVNPSDEKKIILSKEAIAAYKGCSLFINAHEAITNGETFTVESWDKYFVYLLSCDNNSYGVPREAFINRFDYGYFVTSYKYQGTTLEEDYQIHEVEKMNRADLYVSVTRGRKLSQVHFTDDVIVYPPAIRYPHVSKLVKSRSSESYIISIKNTEYKGKACEMIYSKKGHYTDDEVVQYKDKIYYIAKSKTETNEVINRFFNKDKIVRIEEGKTYFRRVEDIGEVKELKTTVRVKCTNISLYKEYLNIPKMQKDRFKICHENVEKTFRFNSSNVREVEQKANEYAKNLAKLKSGEF